MESQLNKKVKQSIRFLQSAQDFCKGQKIELSYSGGKDSDVILRLAQMAGIDFEAIYKNTTIDPSGTIKHCMENNVTILRPKISFFKLIEKKGFPTRRARFCCGYLKEYKVLDNAIQGIRKSESVKRRMMYHEPQICRIYGENKKNKVSVFLPILEWTDEDVREFIQAESIKCHPLYYVGGVFDVKKRLGCMGCPLAHDQGLKDFKERPVLVRAWCRAGNIWLQSHQYTSTAHKFRNVYELFVHNVFYHRYQDFKNAVDGMFGTVDCKQFLEDYFKIKL